MYASRNMATRWSIFGDTVRSNTVETWTRDAVSIVYTCTKAATTLCRHMLVGQKRAGYDTLVGDIWPEFGSVGKEATTLPMMLAHTSPVSHLADTA